MAFKFVEEYIDSGGNKRHAYACDGCHEGDDPDMPDNIVSMFVPYRAVKCDGCGQGWYKSSEELGITPAEKEKAQWDSILKNRGSE